MYNKTYTEWTFQKWILDIAFHNGCIPQVAGQVAIYCNETEDEVLYSGTETSEPSMFTPPFSLCIFHYSS